MCISILISREQCSEQGLGKRLQEAFRHRYVPRFAADAAFVDESGTLRAWSRMAQTAAGKHRYSNESQTSHTLNDLLANYTCPQW